MKTVSDISYGEIEVIRDLWEKNKIKMVEHRGIEPLAFALRTRRSPS